MSDKALINVGIAVTLLVLFTTMLDPRISLILALNFLFVLLALAQSRRKR